jgi:hypothetical protein
MNVSRGLSTVGDGPEASTAHKTMTDMTPTAMANGTHAGLCRVGWLVMALPSRRPASLDACGGPQVGPVSHGHPNGRLPVSDTHKIELPRIAEETLAKANEVATLGNRHTFKVGPGEKPGTTRVELDGTDITKLTTGVTVSYAVGQIPSVELDVLVFEATSDAGLAEIRIPEDTRALLMKFGWSPPTDGTP